MIILLDCVFHETRWDGGNDGTAASYSISDEETAIFGYVGPWDTSQSNPITISVTPQPTTSTIDSTPGDGDDINIFITDDPDFVEFNTDFNFYGLCKHFDVFAASFKEFIMRYLRRFLFRSTVSFLNLLLLLCCCCFVFSNIIMENLVPEVESYI